MKMEPYNNTGVSNGTGSAYPLLQRSSEMFLMVNNDLGI